MKNQLIKRIAALALAAVLAVPTGIMSMPAQTVEAKQWDGTVAFSENFEDAGAVSDKFMTHGTATVDYEDGAVKVTATSHGGARAAFVAVEPEATYKISYRVKGTTEGSGVYSFAQSWYTDEEDKDSAYSDPVYSNVKDVVYATNEWKTVEVTYTVPAEKNTMQFVVYENALASESVFYIDDFKIVKQVETPDLVTNGTFESEGTANSTGWNVSAVEPEQVKDVVYTSLKTIDFNDQTETDSVTSIFAWNLSGLNNNGSLAYKKVDDNMVLAFTRVSDTTAQPYVTYYGTALEKDKTYRVSCKVKSESTELTVGICYDGYGLNWVQQKASNSKWDEITATFTATQNGNTPSLYFKIMDSSNTGTVYIDDIKIEKVTEELKYENSYDAKYTNDFNNKSEKTGLVGTDLIGWNLQNKGDNLAFKTVDGTMTLAFTRTESISGEPYITYYGVTLEDGKTYRVSCKVKTDEESLQFGITYSGYGMPGWEQVTANSSAWQEVTKTFTASNSNSEITSLYFKIMETSKTGTVYIDDVKIEEVTQTPVTAYNANGIVSVGENYVLRMGITDAVVTYDYASALTAGTKYEYAYKVKNDGTENAVLKFAGQEITVAADGEWTTEKGIFTAEEGALDKLNIALISGVVYLDDIEVYQHYCTEVTVKGTPATCEKSGLTDGSKCEVCEKVIKEQTVIPATGHTYNKEVVAAKYLKTPATCQSAAVYYKSCTCGACDTKKAETFTSGDKKAHTYQNKVDKKYLKTPATCTKAAVYYKSCKDCGTQGTETFTNGKALSHNYQETVTAATTSKNGKIVKKCSGCSDVKSTTTIYKASNVSLKTTALSYKGKVQKPTLIVKNSKGKTISSNYYTLTWAKGRKNVGTYTVKITFKGNYKGSKTLSFKINPKKVTINTTAAKKAFTVKWTKQSKSLVTGYQVWYSTDSKFKKSVVKKSVTNNGKTVSYKASKLKGKTKYYVKVRAYTKVGKKTYYSDWSSVKNVTTK